MKGFLYFFKYALKKQPKYILLSVLSTLMSALSPVLLIYIPKLILDTAADGFEQEACFFVLLYVASFLVLNIGISWVRYGAGIYSSKLFTEFQMDMSEKLMDADLDKLESNAFKEQSEKAQNYIYAGGWGFGYIFTCSLQVIQYSITAISYIYIIYQFSILLVAVNLLFTLISFRIGGNIKKKEKQDQDEKIRHERKTSYYTDIISDHRYRKDIRVFSYKPTLMRKMKNHYDANVRFYARINGRHVLSETLSNIFYVIQIGLGYFFVISLLVRGTISVGDFTLYVSALTSYAQIMGTILEKIVYVHSYDMYFQDFREYMNIPKMQSVSGRTVDRTRPLCIEFKNVSFRYGTSVGKAWSRFLMSPQQRWIPRLNMNCTRNTI